MPLDNTEKSLFFSNKDKPIVGLIHKTNATIVFAPCIPQKVSLILNNIGEATSGNFIKDSFEAASTLNDEQLKDINVLLKQKHVPRIAYTYTSPFDETSAHQFLFEQKCGETRPSEWGGFTIHTNAENELEYAFVSGAFNSNPHAKRKKGALLSQDLINRVKEETAVLGKIKTLETIEETFATSQSEEQLGYETPTYCVTPPQKRHCSYGVRTGGLFSPINFCSESEEDSFSPVNFCPESEEGSVSLKTRIL